MSGDFFNEFLVNEWNALDKELGNDQFLTREREIDELRQQQDPQVSEKDQIQLEDLSSPLDQPRSNETKKERLQRVKDEYATPFISVGQIQNRRQKRKQDLAEILKELKYPQDALQDPTMEGTMANSPNFTQLVEQNQATITPLASDIRRFVK